MRVVLVLVVVVVGLCTNGCTFIGMGIGLATTSHDEVASDDLASVKQGKILRVKSHHRKLVEGKFVRADDEVLVVRDTEPKVCEDRCAIARDKVRRVWVKGNRGFTGLLIGLVIDVVILSRGSLVRC